MIVLCINTKIDEVVDLKVRKHIQSNVHMDCIDLDVGREYVVFGVVFREGNAWYYLCDEDDAEYPKPYHSVFFDKIENSIPADWVLMDGYPSSIVPSEWADIPNFFEKLLDGDPSIVERFRVIKRRLLNSGS